MFHKIVISASVLISHYRDTNPATTAFWHPVRLLARLTAAFLVLTLPLTACSTPSSPTVPTTTTEEVRVSSSSGMVLEQSVEELAVEADHIFIGQVQSVHSDWNADKTSIETTVALYVKEYLKSTTFPRDFTLVLPSGTAGDVSVVVEDTPTFTPGEIVLLFLKGDGGPSTLLVGSWQGVYYIEGNEAIQAEVNRRMPLSELRTRIRAATATVPPPAYGGAMMLKRSVGELTTEADRILVADVLAIRSQLNTDGSSINTKVTLAVDKVLKGKAKALETLTLPGGQVGDYGVLVGGVPNFIADERVLLFLDDSSEFVIAGMWQGKYSLSGDKAFQPETGLKVSVASLEQEISRALDAPVEIGTSPEVVHAEYTIWDPDCAWNPANDSIYPIAHYVNSAGSGTGAPSGASFVSLMYKSLYNWQNLSDSWVLLRVVGTTTRDATNHSDGNNDIAWADLSGSTLGVNTCAYIPGGYRIDSDTQLDNSARIWTITAEAGKVDLRSVSEHEFGHGIGLGHSDQACDGTASTPLMCPYVNSGVRKTILTDDSNGAAALYTLSGTAPAAPSGLSATAAGTSNILTWTDNSSNELAFEIQRASGSCGGSFTGVATVPANTTNYTDNDYGVGLTGVYCYRVKALNRGGDSGFSNTDLNQCEDTYEDDDLVGNAESINTIGVAQHRNFHDNGDKDWAKFDVKGSTPYTITTSLVGANADTWLYLYEPNGTTEITNNDDCPGGGKESCIYWTAPTTDTYFIRVHQFGGAGDCSGYEYDLAIVGDVENIFLPLILKNSP
jgi:hypothetical protein